MFHRLDKEAKDRALYMKVERGVETTEKVNVELTMHELRQFAQDYGVTEIDNFIKSSQFSKEYRLEGDKIKTVKEI